MPFGGLTDYDFVEDDTNSKLKVTCTRDDTGAAINLTGATVTLKYKINAGTLATKTMSVEDTTGGVASYTFTSDELAPGIMVAEVQVESGGKVVSSLEPMRFTIRERLA